MSGTAEDAARAQQPPVREILQALWDQFELPNKPGLDEHKDPGGLRACLFTASSDSTSWAETARLRVSEVKDPALEARQAQLARDWLEENGWEELDNPAPEGDLVSYHRNAEGFTVTLTPWGDARVQVDVQSPCFDEQGRQVG
ncbi:hypothetical protein [Serinicoccus marinus]|uniref:hypothetical protein n=1 Tax=Serinicoccus marinus TaxID=247333 RepID=UPI00122E1152|nr:hypothetical protein [Serinicoccus marinus]